MAARECTIDIEVRVSRWRMLALRFALLMARLGLARPAQRIVEAASRKLVWSRMNEGRWEPHEVQPTEPWPR